MSNTLARSICMALLVVCAGVVASPVLAKCPRSCRAELRKDFKACKVACRTTTAAGRCRMACGQVFVEARSRCQHGENPAPRGAGRLAAGCSPDPEEKVEVQTEAVLGTTTYDPGCVMDAAKIDLAYAYARIATNSPAFVECIDKAYSSNVTFTPPNFGTMNIGPYIPCSTDPPTPGPATILASVNTANPTNIKCDYGKLGTSEGGYAGVGGVPADDSVTPESITLGSTLGWLIGGVEPCFASPTGSYCVSEQGFAEVGSTILHEVMHQHGYDHFEYGDPPFLCGIPAEKNPQYANSVNYQVGECIRVVLEESSDNCSMHSCPNGGLRLQDSLFGSGSPTCSCVADPKQPGNAALASAVTPVCTTARWKCASPTTSRTPSSCAIPRRRARTFSSTARHHRASSRC